VRENKRSTEKREAVRLLNKRVGAVAEGKSVPTNPSKVRLADLADLIRARYQSQGFRSADRIEASLAAWRLGFGRLCPPIPSSGRSRLAASAPASALPPAVAFPPAPLRAMPPARHASRRSIQSCSQSSLRFQTRTASTSTSSRIFFSIACSTVAIASAARSPSFVGVSTI
jgi:hypothetical protein